MLEHLQNIVSRIVLALFPVLLVIVLIIFAIELFQFGMYYKR